METNINKSSDSDYNRGIERESWKVMAEHLYSDMKSLLEKESALIRTEVNEKIVEAKKAVISMVLGGTILFVGIFSLTATAIIVLNRFMPLWGAAALVTVILLGVGFVMLNTAKQKLTADKITPNQSLETLREIKTTFKERINEFKQHH